MAGINTTGKPNTSDYVLGRGIVYFAPNDSNGYPLGYDDLGNATEFSMSIETESLEHQSSRGGLKVTDKEVPISQKLSVTLTLDEVNFGNLARFVSGTATTRANTATVTPTAYVDDTPGPESGGNLRMPANSGGKWFDLYDTATGIVYLGSAGDSQGKRIYNVGAVTITGQDEGAGIGAEGTDFDIDSKMGRIFITKGGLLDLGAEHVYEITIAAHATPQATVDVVKALQTTAITGTLKFISSNPADGDKQTEYQFHQISLKAEGDFGLISDDWSQMQLTGSAESNALADPDSPTLTITTHAGA